MGVCPTCGGTGHYELKGPPLTEIKRLLEAGLSYQKVANAVGMSKSAVYYHSKKMNIKPKFRPDLINNLEAKDVLAQQ